MYKLKVMPRGKNKLVNSPKRGKQSRIFTHKRAAQLNSNTASVTGEVSSPKATASQQPQVKWSKKLITQGLSDTHTVVHSQSQPLIGEIDASTELVVGTSGELVRSVNNNASLMHNPNKEELDQGLDEFD